MLDATLNWATESPMVICDRFTGPPKTWEPLERMAEPSPLTEEDAASDELGFEPQVPPSSNVVPEATEYEPELVPAPLESLSPPP